MTKEERNAVIYYDNWQNAREMHLKNSESFHWESYDIAIGDIIKICNNKERFWCQVVEIKPTGEVIVYVCVNICIYMYCIHLCICM